MQQTGKLHRYSTSAVMLVGAVVAIVSIWRPLWKLEYPGSGIAPAYGSIWKTAEHPDHWWAFAVLAGGLWIAVYAAIQAIWPDRLGRWRMPVWAFGGVLSLVGIALALGAMHDVQLMHRVGMRTQYGAWMLVVGCGLVLIGNLWHVLPKFSGPERLTIVAISIVVIGSGYALRVATPVPLPGPPTDLPDSLSDSMQPTKANERTNDINRALGLIAKVLNATIPCASMGTASDCSDKTISTTDPTLKKPLEDGLLTVKFSGASYTAQAYTTTKPKITFTYNSNDGSRTCTPTITPGCAQGTW